MNRWRISLPSLALVFAAGGGYAPAGDGKAPLATTRAEGLVLDGAVTEEAWKGAATIPAEPLGEKPPGVRALVSRGALWVAVEAAEDPGFPIGVRMMVAPEGAPSAADAVALSFAPLDTRAPRYVARGPKGVGRAVYRVRGAADLSRLDAWSAEVSIPLADLGVSSEEAVLALGVVVAGRAVNVLASAPAAALFDGPASWARLKAPEGGWRASDDPGVDSDAIAREDAADAQRMEAWAAFLEDRLAIVSAEGKKTRLAGDVERAMRARPDLATLRWTRGVIRAEVGDLAGAMEDYETVLKVVPGFREAEWGRDQLVARALTEPPGTQPSDYDAAFARIEATGRKLGARSSAARLANAYLLYRKGEFASAVEAFAPILQKYPVDDETTRRASASRRYAESWGEELGYRRADAAKDDLPRARLVTSKGEILLELFEDEARNTVRNFVFLADQKFYDGTRFHRVIPFFMAQGGGTKSPGYAIPTELGRRKPYRGTVGMAQFGRPDTEGSQFFVTTGTSAHLEGQFTIFGRVLEGQEVADRLVLDDVLEKVEVVRRREGTTYHPTTVSGQPARLNPR